MEAAVRILSWNIFRNYRPALIERHLRRLLETHEPDLLLLQEAPVYESRGFADLELFEAYHGLYAPVHTIREAGPRLAFRSTGQLLLSRRPFRRNAVHELPLIGERFRRGSPNPVRRVALYAQFALPGERTLGVYNVHLENRSLPSGRLEQVRHLLDVIRRNPDDVVVVGGDFNTFLTSIFERSLDLFRREGFSDVYISKLRLLPRLDYFMVRGARAALALPLRGRGSDHQPIMVSITT